MHPRTKILIAPILGYASFANNREIKHGTRTCRRSNMRPRTKFLIAPIPGYVSYANNRGIKYDTPEQHEAQLSRAPYVNYAAKHAITRKSEPIHTDPWRTTVCLELIDISMRVSAFLAKLSGYSGLKYSGITMYKIIWTCFNILVHDSQTCTRW